jgi:hypothetical protein
MSKCVISDTFMFGGIFLTLREIGQPLIDSSLYLICVCPDNRTKLFIFNKKLEIWYNWDIDIIITVYIKAKYCNYGDLTSAKWSKKKYK